MNKTTDKAHITTQVCWEVVFHPYSKQLHGDGAFGDMLDALAVYFDNPISTWMDNVSVAANFEKRISFTIPKPESFLGPQTLEDYQDRITQIIADLGYEGYTDILRIVVTEPEDVGD